MKNHIKLLVLLLAAIMLLQSTVFTALAFQPIEIDLGIYEASGQPSKYSSQYNSGDRDVVATTLNGTSASSYYTGSNVYDVLSEQSATAIQSALSSLMKSTHSYKSSYDDCHYKANRTDCENENGSSNKLSLIYTSYTATMSQWNGWNREHVWPKSLGGDTTTGGGSDLHHIRPSDAVVNSTRSNDKYGNVTNSSSNAVYGRTPASGCLGGYSSGSYFEPLDNVKGDVARICLYVYVRWGSEWGATSITKVFQSVDVLLEWMELDPVDTWELGRNEVVQDIQGNRNVFIDYPEYAWLIFGKEVPEDLVTPSGKAQSNAHHWDNGSITTAATCTTKGVITYTCTDSGCGATKTESIAILSHSWDNGSVTKDATCEATGTKTYTCSSCKKTKTETIKALGHSYGSWIVDTEATETTAGSKHRNCSTCGSTETLTIPIIGHTHSYSSVITKPTCTEQGYTTHTCNCGETYVDSYTSTISHIYQNGTCVNCGSVDPSAPVYTVEDFNYYISALSIGLSGEDLYQAIHDSIVVYNSLSADDKASVAPQYALLKQAVEDYNSTVISLNDDANEINTALFGDQTMYVNVLAFALYDLICKKHA